MIEIWIQIYSALTKPHEWELRTTRFSWIKEEEEEESLFLSDIIQCTTWWNWYSAFNPSGGSSKQCTVPWDQLWTLIWARAPSGPSTYVHVLIVDDPHKLRENMQSTHRTALSQHDLNLLWGSSCNYCANVVPQNQWTINRKQYYTIQIYHIVFIWRIFHTVAVGKMTYRHTDSPLTSLLQCSSVCLLAGKNKVILQNKGSGSFVEEELFSQDTIPSVGQGDTPLTR